MLKAGIVPVPSPKDIGWVSAPLVRRPVVAQWKWFNGVADADAVCVCVLSCLSRPFHH